MCRDPNSYDVAVIGASLAGSAAAVTLARRGARVALFEKARPFREKPCGEGLSKSGVVAATRLGFWSEEDPPLSFLPYEGFVFRRGDVERRMTLRRGGIAVERRLFDAHVMDVAAQTPGVELFFGAYARAEVATDGVAVSSPHGRIEAQYLVVGDGSRSPVARSLAIQELRTAPPRMGATCHYRGRFREHARFVHIEIHDDFELYATPLADGRLNVAVLAAHGESLNLSHIVHDHRALRWIFDSMTFEGELDGVVLGRAPIGGVERIGAPPGVLLVGDAAEEFDPIGGMGMTHALLSGELAGHLIIKDFGGDPETRDRVTERYEHLRAALAQPFRRFTSLTYHTLRSSVRWPMLLRLATSRLGERVVDRLVP